MRHAALLLTLGSLSNAFVLQAHASTPGEFRLVAQTRHGRYYAEPRTQVDVKRTEAFLARLFALLGAPPQDWRLEYYRYESTERLSQRIGFAAYGVTDLATSRIDSTRGFHPHELVHVVAGRLGRPPLLFTEGLAVALTAQGRWRGREQDDVARAYLSAGGGLGRLILDFAAEQPDRDYALAGSFVTHLLDRHGIEPLMALFSGCGADAGRYEGALRAAYGAGLFELEQDWAHRLMASTRRSRHDWFEARSWPGTLRSRPGVLAANAGTTSLDAAGSAQATALEHAAASRRPAAPDPVSNDRKDD